MYYLAIDIGASSGRHIVGWREEGQIRTREVYRFPNGVKETAEGLTWDIEALTEHVIAGVGEAFKLYPAIESLSIDTWGVDYVLLKGEEEVLPCFAYRNERTQKRIDEVHERIPFERLYALTGCRFQPFNTLYQVYDDLKRGRLEGVTDLLMMPEYLMWKLTGVKMREFTNATTTGMINGQTGQFDGEIMEALGLPKHLFPEVKAPGTVLGPLKDDIAQRVGGNCRVILCATHDTGSAVEGIPMKEDAPYISSGTWSLLGIKTPRPITNASSRAANYSNEGGVGYNRYQKNIMGMWLVNELKRELCPETPFSRIVEMAEASTCHLMVDANAPAFLSPPSMKTAFDEATGNGLKTTGDYFRCAYASLAESYRKALKELAQNTGKACTALYIVGGGAKNQLLNRLTQETAGVEVKALPIEATALGNLKIQMEANQA